MACSITQSIREVEVFHVNVMVQEAKHLPIADASTIIVAKINTVKKIIRAKTRNTDNPLYNGLAIFPFNLSLHALLERHLKLTVYQLCKFNSKKQAIGTFCVQLATVWNQPDHQFHHKWAALASLKNPISQNRGFLKCDISILCKGATIKIMREINQDIKDNLMIQDTKRVKFKITIYRADGLERRCNYLTTVVKFAGRTRTTTAIRNNSTPEWNQRVEFFDFFPGLCQYMYFELQDQKQLVGSGCMDIQLASQQNLHLPAFGPSFLYLNNKLDNMYITFAGRLLVSLRAETILPDRHKTFHTKLTGKKFQKNDTRVNVSPLQESQLWTNKEFLLLAAIYDVLFLDKKYQSTKNKASVKITLGPKNQNVMKNITSTEKIHILSVMCTAEQQNYGELSLTGKVSTPHTRGIWPDKRKQIWRQNMIKETVVRFHTMINEIQSNQNYDIFKEAMIELSQECKEILRVVDLSDLDTIRKEHFIHEVRTIQKEAFLMSSKRLQIEKGSIQKAEEYVRRLKECTNGPDMSFPNTEVWLTRESSKNIIAQHRVDTQNVLFSTDPRQCGKNCGKRQTFLVSGKNKNVVAKIDLSLWFGLTSDLKSCLDMLPAGYTTEFKDGVPIMLNYTERHVFMCRVHVFQAKILHGADANGLADPYALVTIHGNETFTQSKSATLNPIWDETLHIMNVVLFGPGENIKKEPSKALVEVFDWDNHSREIIGRAVVPPLVKMLHDKYLPPTFPPKLQWFKLHDDSRETGEIQLAIELVEILPNGSSANQHNSTVMRIPNDIRPHLKYHRLEVMFWGMRDMKNTSHKLIIELECAGRTITSPVLKNVKENPNFPRQIGYLKISLAQEYHYYSTPLTMKLFRNGNTKASSFIATCIVPSIKDFLVALIGEDERLSRIQELAVAQVAKDNNILKNKTAVFSNELGLIIKTSGTMNKVSTAMNKLKISILHIFSRNHHYEMVDVKPEHDDLDWWAKYFSSKENLHDGIGAIQIYNNELEAQPEFTGFRDYLQTFIFSTGKIRRNFDIKKTVAVCKGAIKMYTWPTEEGEVTLDGENPALGLLTTLPTNESMKILIRVYVVAGLMLTPKDKHGLSDPYVVVQIGRQKKNSKKEYIHKQINPLFGKCFEFKTILPNDNKVKVQVFDFDMLSKNDLIGETEIDIENRLYTKHHAACGIQSRYEESGLNRWRAMFLPSEILASLCDKYKLPCPVYRHNSVQIDLFKFTTCVIDKNTAKEEIALNALHNWHEIPMKGFSLVPEHIETRTLTHPHQPGIEQGKLEMWIDIFPIGCGSIPPAVDISQKKPEPMELRVIVWNTSKIPMADDSILFDKMSDIYVRGWITSPEEQQVTDIHYRSMNGEGNFNWRFVFAFEYVKTEKKMIVKKKLIFVKRPQEEKRACRLELQVWDNDTFEDDFIGALSLDLAAMPQGTKLAKSCDLSIFSSTHKQINLFKVGRTRGWWPFRKKSRGGSGKGEVDGFTPAGKVELELELMTANDAAANPVGLGRAPPHELPEPNRPDTSFNWMFNPLGSIRYIVCIKCRSCAAIIIILAAVVVFFVVAVYSFPGYMIKKILNA